VKVTICGFSFELPDVLKADDKDRYASLETEHDVQNVETERKVLLATMRRTSNTLEKYTKLSERAYKKLEDMLDNGEKSEAAERYYDDALARRSEAEQAQDISTITHNETLGELNRKSNLFYLSFVHYLAVEYAECADSLSDWNYKAVMDDYAVSYQVIEKKYFLLGSKSKGKVLLDTTERTRRKSA
jgi:hypothetical protein